jgi:histidyl-tRNA synthetase
LTVLFINFGNKELEKCMDLAAELRKSGIDCEIYPTSAKIQKQMKYANDRGVKYTILLGENELLNKSVLLKNMTSGEQKEISFEEIIMALKN